MRLDAKQTGLDTAAYDALPPATKALYVWNASKKAWVADELTAPKLERVSEALSADATRTVSPTDKPGRW